MKAGDLHAAWRALPMATPWDITGGKPFVVISPHPDDESLGLGGLIAAARADGIDVRVVVVSDGAGSHPNSRRVPHDDLVVLRRTETDAAARALGLAPGSVTHLDLPDTAVPMDGLAFEAAVAHLASVVEACGAASCFVTWGHDPHCDHEAADAMARHLRRHRPALRYWSYPIWGWHLDAAETVAAPAPKGFRIDIAPWQAAKHQAIAAHASQMTALIDDDPEGFRFTDDTLAPFLQPVETVFELSA
ncbi:PIG-L family deacetylase [Lichenihabitans sp. Uapishka_5]|uniref:PIG-L deacetylase family protein n=1 Tax=Lichenihabitans sp. Uapishka_5 TaxID=3037302 RepID=UPI0029E7E6F0|nr:PIG-L family deacetylase [Lichenihabitans sp. Uapishka_5]MDX7951686.1 PIG-L family deacetylase [Lichenihabitans sp. Uapishka_5]